MTSALREPHESLCALGIRVSSLRELLDERNIRYEAAFQAAKEAVASALTATKELTAASFAAAEKAILKAEEAQKSYNERSNEFRATLDDQNKRSISRVEFDNAVISIQTQIADHKESDVRTHLEVNKQISELRETRSTNMGREDAEATKHNDVQNLVKTVISIVSVLIAFAALFGVWAITVGEKVAK